MAAEMKNAKRNNNTYGTYDYGSNPFGFFFRLYSPSICHSLTNHPLINRHESEESEFIDIVILLFVFFLHFVFRL